MSEEQEPACRLCELKIPMIYYVQGRKMMHEARGLSVESCERVEHALRQLKQRKAAP